MNNKKTIIKNKINFVAIVLFLFSMLFVLTGCADLVYDTSRDTVIESPDKSYSVTIRYDYVSRPDLYIDGEKIFEYDGSGFMESVGWNIEWLSEKEILLYIQSPQKEKYSKEKYKIVIE